MLCSLKTAGYAFKQRQERPLSGKAIRQYNFFAKCNFSFLRLLGAVWRYFCHKNSIRGAFLLENEAFSLAGKAGCGSRIRPFHGEK